jgi:prepilin-type N-terminal cleavage/methylation domain-containing protein
MIQPAKFQRTAFALVEILVVVAILSLLTMGYLQRLTALTASGNQPRATISKASRAACLANRATLSQTIEIYLIDNPRGPVSGDALTAKGIRIPTCPDGGAYGWTGKGPILCSVHRD